MRKFWPIVRYVLSGYHPERSTRGGGGTSRGGEIRILVGNLPNTNLGAKRSFR